jgi:hypothetical protein
LTKAIIRKLYRYAVEFKDYSTLVAIHHVVPPASFTPPRLSFIPGVVVHQHRLAGQRRAWNETRRMHGSWVCGAHARCADFPSIRSGSRRGL